MALNPLDWGVSASVEGYLLTSAQNLGWCMPTGFGPAPLTWAEIYAYGQATGDLKEPWEYQVVRDMSVAYLAGHLSEVGVDPAEWILYKGLMMPLLPLRDKGRARLAQVTVEK